MDEERGVELALAARCTSEWSSSWITSASVGLICRYARPTHPGRVLGCSSTPIRLPLAEVVDQEVGGEGQDDLRIRDRIHDFPNAREGDLVIAALIRGQEDGAGPDRLLLATNSMMRAEWEAKSSLIK